MRRSLALVIAALAVVVMTLGCGRGTPVPRGEAGVLDLRAWDFRQQPVLELGGEWELYWETFADSREALAGRAPDAMFVFPGDWRAKKLRDGRVLKSAGYGTFHLRVLLPERRAADDDADDAWWSIQVRTIDTAYRLVVRDAQGAVVTRPMVAGKLATSLEAAVPRHLRQVRAFAPPASPELDLYLEISNFHDHTGGPAWTPLFGTERGVHSAVAAQQQADLIITGVILVMGLYHLGIFAMRRREQAPLWFGLFCLVVAARTFTVGRFLEERVPDVGGWEVRAKLEYMQIYVAVAIFVMFLKSLFPDDVPRTFVRILQGASAICIAFTIAVPFIISGRILRPFEVVMVISGVIILGLLARILSRHRGSNVPKLITAGTLALLITTTNDILHATHIVDTTYMAHYGLFTFIFFQSLIIAVLNQRQRQRAEALASELDVKNTELSRIDQLKDEFLANTSHELRTPLNGIIGLAESLLDGAAGMLSERVRANLVMIASSGRRLASLVNDILDFSKLRHKNILLAQRPVDARAMVETVLALAQPLVGKKNLELVNAIHEAAPTVLADENRFQQILLSLIGNAIKFTAEGTSAVSCERRERMLAITIADTGIGVPESKRERIFESFEQGEGGAAREYGGTGLGLAITRQLVELHGGTIGVDSTRGAGARFTFTLPLSDEPARLAESVAVVSIPRGGEVEPIRAATNGTTIRPSMAPRRRFHVLAVDDDPINLAVLQNQLGAGDYRVTTAENGPDALAHLERGERFDGILLDVMMPKMTGYEVCRRVRTRFPANELPVVLLTAKNQIADLVTGFEAGANDYLTKPFSKRELLSRIHTHISLAKKNIAYGKFVPKEFLQLLGKDDLVDVDLGDQVQKEMSLLFCDIRSFTSLSETLSPEETFRFLNVCLGRFGPVVRKHGGFVDKFIGDAILALFPGSPEDAVRAALEIQREVRALNREPRAASMPALSVGIGIHTGSTMLGTIGEAERMEGTVISDAVNLASRIEGVTKAFGVSILVSEVTLSAITDAELYQPRFLGLVQMRGKAKPVAVFEILGADAFGPTSRRAGAGNDFQDALRLFQARDFKRAAERFSAILTRNDDDGPARVYLAECRRLEAGTPPNWDGAVSFDAK